ncbi:hypothetical protein P43SY_002600 [Pythium insidiosum]|uniref:Protein S-acyltransferase n=1 Tax=Pythium insidiosum TaxID=114742 RepID=A0AAD5MC75_PYTIN|nr:hypothetical protein P43SY_002600 [Pythium insidiosum]
MSDDGGRDVGGTDNDSDGSEDEGETIEMSVNEFEDQEEDGSLLVFCDECNLYRPTSPWVNNCIGAGNQKYFLLFLLYVTISSFQVIVLVSVERLTCCAFGLFCLIMLVMELYSIDDDELYSQIAQRLHSPAVYCIIKRKIRPLDVLTCEATDIDGSIRREFACCGVSYGLGADIAMESEKTRWLGVHRYKWLKAKRGVFAPRPHECTIKYVLSDDVKKDPVTGNQLLQTYYEICEENADDQHHIEMCSVYDDCYQEKRWQGDANSIFKPASEERYAGRWQQEGGRYATVGASNVYFETQYYHPSDGNMDLIIARKGPLLQTIDVGLKYIAGNYLDSPLIGYHKIKALVIEQNVDDPINVDGEVFAGPGPFRIEVVPRLLCVLSEK